MGGRSRVQKVCRSRAGGNPYGASARVNRPIDSRLHGNDKGGWAVILSVRAIWLKVVPLKCVPFSFHGILDPESLILNPATGTAKTCPELVEGPPRRQENQERESR